MLRICLFVAKDLLKMKAQLTKGDNHMPLIKENNKNTEYSYDIVTARDDVVTECGKVVLISKIASKCELQYDLADGRLVAGKETATGDELEWANYHVQTHLRDWQAKAGLRYVVRFCAESDCYYDFTGQKLYNASGKKNKKDIDKKPIKFTPMERDIITRLVNMVGYVCEYSDISLAATGSETGIFPKTIHVHISNIRAYDDVAIRPVIEESGNGYTYVGPAAKWIVDAPEKRESKKCEFPLLNYGTKLFDKGKIEKIAYLTQNGSVKVYDTPNVTVGAICNFFFPSAITWFENCSISNIENFDKTLLVRYVNSVYNASDMEWSASIQHVREQMGLAVKLRLYPMINPSNPIPQNSDDLSRVTIQIDNFVDGIFDQVLNWVSSLVNDDVYINANFFMGKPVCLTKANLLDAIVALSWISLYQELVCGFPLLSAEWEKYRKALSKNIKRIFFPPSSAELEELMTVCDAAREAFDKAVRELDNRRELKEDFDKFFVELLNLNEILKNPGIRLSEATNSNENEPPIKVR